MSIEKPSVYSVVLNNFQNDNRVRKQAVSLASNGYHVTVVAIWENGLQTTEAFSDFSVVRIKLLSKSWPRLLPFQVFKYLEFVTRAFFLVRKGRYIHCNDLDALTVGYLCKLFRVTKKSEIKVIYDAHELETEVESLVGFGKIIAKILEKTMIARVDASITVCDSIANIYAEQYKIAKPQVVRNIPIYEVVHESFILRQLHNIPTNKFIFISQGMLSPGRGLETLLVIAEQNQSEGFVIVFMGKGILEKKIRDAARRLSNVFFQPFVKPEEITFYTSSADCGICFTEDICLNSHYCLPNKLFEYMMAEIPIICSDLPEMKNFVETTGTGYTVNSTSPDDLLRVMKLVMDSDKNDIKRKLVEAKKHHNWSNEEITLLETYKSL